MEISFIMEKVDPSVRLYVPLPIEALRDSLQNKKSAFLSAGYAYCRYFKKHRAGKESIEMNERLVRFRVFPLVMLTSIGIYLSDGVYFI